MALLSLARTFLSAHRALLRLLEAALSDLWDELDPGDLSGSWERQRTGERAFVTISTYQAAAASRASEWIRQAVEEQGASPAAQEQVDPRRFAGRSSDGGLLEPRLYTPVVNAKLRIRRGVPPEQAIPAAGRSLGRLGVSEVADASRASSQAAIAAEPAITGWVRVVNLPACGRCVALAAEVLSWDSPIRAHPRCDCTIAPAVDDGADDLLVDPLSYFESLSDEEQVARFGVSTAQAIRDGADPRAAVNPTRPAAGMGVVGELNPRPAGPTVRSLLAESGGDRVEALRLLRANGFLL